MTGDVMALGRVSGRPAAALLEGGLLQDLLVDSPGSAGQRPEAVLRAVVDRPAKGLGGCFVKLPDGGSGFLRGGARPPGSSVLVQVTGCAEEGKAIPVTARILIKGRYGIVTPGAPGRNVARSVKDEGERRRLGEIAGEAMGGAPSGAGLVMRSACEGADSEAIRAEIESLLDSLGRIEAAGGSGPELLLPPPGAHELARREWPAASVADGEECLERLGVLDQIDSLLEPGFPLKGGGSGFIEPTRAMVCVDVNTGPDMSPSAGMRANLDLAAELPRQLRLRGLGGQIVVDLAPLARGSRRRFQEALGRGFSSDPVGAELLGWTPLGHFEMRRRRERVSLAAALG